MFDTFNMEEFEPEEADPDLFRRKRSGSVQVPRGLRLSFVHVYCCYDCHPDNEHHEVKCRPLTKKLPKTEEERNQGKTRKKIATILVPFHNRSPLSSSTSSRSEHLSEPPDKPRSQVSIFLPPSPVRVFPLCSRRRFSIPPARPFSSNLMAFVVSAETFGICRGAVVRFVAYHVVKVQEGINPPGCILEKVR